MRISDWSSTCALPISRRAAPTALIARRSQRRSDRFREARWLFGWLLEIAIEAHRYDTHQQPSARGGLDEARPHLDQPIGLQRRQPRQGVGEIAQEIEIEARLDVGEIGRASGRERG